MPLDLLVPASLWRREVRGGGEGERGGGEEEKDDLYSSCYVSK